MRAEDEPKIDPDATVRVAPREQPGQQIGRYKLLQVIGEGGFGAVWLAEQSKPVRRRVALKIIKLGMDTEQVIARFEAERQALAMMDHPNIAKVLDAGATETGRPYFVMEHVRGEPITHYCDKHNLSVQDRLRLFQQTCHAVQHAHQKGIIHRDLKPGNVLVAVHDGNPVPTVIDFGIAKAMNSRLTEKTIFTEFQQLIGTPEYMSPEQAEMSELDIDTRSDVYSLGVLLYELLTGTTPFDSQQLRSAAYGEIQRIIREVAPPKPSTRLSTVGSIKEIAAHRRIDPQRLGTIIRGELDWIVMRAMEKDRTRRYETANGLAADVERYLNHEPVVASPPSTVYRCRKFVQRNKAGVSAAIIGLSLLVLGVVGTTWGMVWALHERDRADQEATNARLAASAEETAKRDALLAATEAQQRADEVELISDFQAQQLSAIDPEMMGSQLRSLITDSVPESERISFDAMLVSVEFTDVALAVLQKHVLARALAAANEQFADQPLLRARLLQATAKTAADLGLIRFAEEPQREALRLRIAHLGEQHIETAESFLRMGELAFHANLLKDAQSWFLRAHDAAAAAAGPDHPLTMEADNNVGITWFGVDFAKADRLIGRALKARERVLGPDHPDTLESYNNLGASLNLQGRYAEALPLFERALDGRRRVLGPSHPMTVNSLHNIGNLHERCDRPAAALPYCREAYETSLRIMGSGHTATLTTQYGLARVMWDLGGEHANEALKLQRQAYAEARQSLGVQNAHTANYGSTLASWLFESGRHDEAVAIAEELLATHLQIRSPEVATALGRVMELHYNLGNYEACVTAWKEVSPRIEWPERRPVLQMNTTMYAGLSLLRLEKFDEALPLLENSVTLRSVASGPTDAITIRYTYWVCRCLISLGRAEDASSIAKTTFAEVRAAHDAGSKEMMRAIHLYGFVLSETKRFDENVALAEQYGQSVAAADGPSDAYSMYWACRYFGEAMVEVHRFEEAEQYYQKALELVEPAGMDDSGQLRLARDFVFLYQRWSDADGPTDLGERLRRWQATLSELERDNTAATDE